MSCNYIEKQYLTVTLDLAFPTMLASTKGIWGRIREQLRRTISAGREHRVLIPNKGPEAIVPSYNGLLDRRILGVLSLMKKYGTAAVDDACAVVLDIGVAEHRFVRRYLVRTRKCFCARSIL